MEKTYEGKITGEIRRSLRNLEEACAEQQITMQEALEWYLVNKEKTKNVSKEQISAKQEISYRERAELFVSKHVEKQEQKDICVFILCYMNQYEKCPTLESILKELDSNLYINRRHTGELKFIMCEALSKMTWSYHGNSGEPCYYGFRIHPTNIKDWKELRREVFCIAKTL